jgi:hypothetical protein
MDLQTRSSVDGEAQLEKSPARAAILLVLCGSVALALPGIPANGATIRLRHAMLPASMAGGVPPENVARAIAANRLAFGPDDLPAVQTGVTPVTTSSALSQQKSEPDPQTGIITGTVKDLNGDAIADATVVLEGPSTGDRRSVTTNENGIFQLKDLNPGTPFHIAVSANGFTVWTSRDIIVEPGQVQ